MTTVSIPEAISDLKKLFRINTGHSLVDGSRFYICKWEYTRDDIHRILSDYFSEHMLEPGWKLILDPIEYIYSEFYLTQEQ